MPCGTGNYLRAMWIEFGFQRSRPESLSSERHPFLLEAGASFLMALKTGIDTRGLVPADVAQEAVVLWRKVGELFYQLLLSLKEIFNTRKWACFLASNETLKHKWCACVEATLWQSLLSPQFCLCVFNNFLFWNSKPIRCCKYSMGRLIVFCTVYIFVCYY